MRIIISPTKKMVTNTDLMGFRQLPYFLDKTKELYEYVSSLSYDQLKSIWKCSDAIAMENLDRIKLIGFEDISKLTPAILAYEGMQFKHMSPTVLEDEEIEFLEEHLRILSGFYGLLRPFDGIESYRLEMQSKFQDRDLTLYNFWGDKIANRLFEESQCIINLASKEYSKVIENYINPNIRFITCTFGELINDCIVEKGTLCKMARGEMVRFIAKKQITIPETIKEFDGLDFKYCDNLSSGSNFVFIKFKS